MKATLANPYPRTFEELLDWFPKEEDRGAYLEWIRWPEVFVCPECGATSAWRTDCAPRQTRRHLSLPAEEDSFQIGGDTS